MSVVSLIPQKFIEDLERNLVTSCVVALKQLDKVVTAKTARSIRPETSRTSTEIVTEIYAAGGMKYIVEGKPANTRLPMRKVGNEWELVQELKDWKAIKGYDVDDFLLARGIAKRKRDPVDVAAKTLSVFQQMYARKTNAELLTLTASLMGEQFKKI